MRKRLFVVSGMALALTLGLAMPMAAQAQVVTQQQMVQSTTAPVVTTTSVGRFNAGEHLYFHVVNPTAGPVHFQIREMGINYPVPAYSDRTFFVDTSNVLDREIAYAITGPDGTTQLASGVVINEDYLAPSGTAISLEHIINYSTAYSDPIDPEPDYVERPVALPRSNGQTIRGYW